MTLRSENLLQDPSPVSACLYFVPSTSNPVHRQVYCRPQHILPQKKGVRFTQFLNDVKNASKNSYRFIISAYAIVQANGHLETIQMGPDKRATGLLSVVGFEAEYRSEAGLPITSGFQTVHHDHLFLGRVMGHEKIILRLAQGTVM
jgi:hypothetical protein